MVGRVVSVLVLKCRCGFNDTLSLKQAESLRWTESGEVKCKCGKFIDYKGHSANVRFGAFWQQSSNGVKNDG